MKDAYTWLKDRIPDMINLGKRVSNINPNTTFPVSGTWPVVKLGILSYYADVYTTIINKQIQKGNMTEMIFIDLLAGSGVTKIKSYNCRIPGSTILLSKIPKVPFTKYIAVDHKKVQLDTLEKRFQYISPNLELVSIFGDCNKVVDLVCDHLSIDTHYLAFIDNQGCDVHWKTICKLLDFSGDICINFPTEGIIRNAKILEKTDKLKRFLGREDYPDNVNSYDTPTEITQKFLDDYVYRVSNYTNNSNDNRLRNISIPIHKGQGNNQIIYDLIFAAKKTYGGSKWFNVLSDLKEIAQNSPEKFVDGLFDQEMKGQSSLSDFFPGN